MAQPVGETENVYACVPGCGALVVNRTIHADVCPAKRVILDNDDGQESFRDRVLAWLDELDPAELERASIDNAGFDTNVTTAVMNELRRRAAAL